MVQGLLLAAAWTQAAVWSEGQQAVEEWLGRTGAVGVSVAVVDDGAEWTAQAGWADREGQDPVRPETLFRLASISKPVCATLTMSLVQRRKLDLDARISRYVPGFPDEGCAITLRRVLSHTAGIRGYRPGRPDVFYRSLSTAEAVELIRNSPLRFEPGTAYGYSTHAFALAVAAMERAAGRPYRELLRFGVSRWGMDSLDVEVGAEAKPERTALYSATSLGPAVRVLRREDISWKAGGGGLEGTALHVARFGLAVLRAKIVGTRERDAMWTPVRLPNGRSTGYGLGWASDPATAWHSGGQQGCSSFLLVDRRRGVSAAVLCNTGGVDAGSLAKTLRDLWVGRASGLRAGADR